MHTPDTFHNESYIRQGFGSSFEIQAPIGLLIVDFINAFADPDVFGGGNINLAIERTEHLLEHARRERWPIAHSRIVFADDASDANIFTLKVPNLIRLTETNPLSAIVPSLAPVSGELVVRKTVPSAFIGTPLLGWLTERRTQSLIVAGASTSGCVRASVVDAMSYGFRPVVVSDCVGDRAQTPHEASLFDMAQKYATVLTRDQLLMDHLSMAYTTTI